MINAGSEGKGAVALGRGYFEGQSHKLILKNDDKERDYYWYHSGHFE